MDEESKTPAGVVITTDARSDETPVQNDDSVSTMSSKVPWSMKVIAVALVTAIGFGSHWASGVTGAMKSTLKTVSRPPNLWFCNSNNFKFRSLTFPTHNTLS